MQAIRSTRLGGHVRNVAVAHDVELPGDELFFSAVHLHGGPAPVRRFLPDLIERIWNREINPGKVFDLELPLEQAADGYSAMDERRDQGSAPSTKRGTMRMRFTVAAVIGTASLALAACGTDEPIDPQPSEPTGAESNEATSPAQEDDMKIEISIGSQRFQAMLDDSAAAHDLIDQLPVTLNMQDHGGVEKTGRLRSALSLKGQPSGADPDVGDVGYYAPGNDLVLYYGDQSYFDGIVVLGHMEGDAAERIADMDGAVTATVTPRDG